MTQSETVVGLPPRKAAPSAATLFELGLRLSAPWAGRRRDRVTALALFDIAARLGSIEAKIYRHELADELGLDEVAAAQAMARDWLAAG